MNPGSMNADLKRRLSLPIDQADAELSGTAVDTNASASMVNRTHRVVRERARKLQARRSLVRSLWLPIAIFSGILIVICTALWTVLDGYELAPTGIPDASQQMFVLMVWCLPMSAALLALVLFRRSKTDSGNPQ